ncbi:hypothetical protein HP397_04330 [Streptobacillus felis]|uniref:Lipoprotein n=1 Tax=Streptobacillus felis TaxID=1384509 RepID=A0A7Z0T8K4_9FUSO|nr:hypothetical protein [Streptobacillus felis]NYV28039.1 hypothetical protein [Streptobacillus felis]
MKKYLGIMILAFTAISCTSLDEYLKDRNLITQNDHIKYIEIKEKKEEKPVKKEEKKVETKKQEIVKVEKKTEVVEKKVDPKKNVVNPKNAKTNAEVKSTIIKSENPVKEVKKEEKKVVENKVVEKKEVVEVKVSNTKIEETVVKFDDTDLKIVKFIAEQVVENEEQIKRKTVESIQRLEEKGYKYSAREFLAKAYDNIKKTNVNSYILAAARVMNNIEREGR